MNLFFLNGDQRSHRYRPFQKVRETRCESQYGAACCIGGGGWSFGRELLKRSIYKNKSIFMVQGEPNNRTNQRFSALRMSNICHQNVSKQLLRLKFSFSIIQFETIAFTHSSVKELSQIRSANKVTGKYV